MEFSDNTLLPFDCIVHIHLYHEIRLKFCHQFFRQRTIRIKQSCRIFQQHLTRLHPCVSAPAGAASVEFSPSGAVSILFSSPLENIPYWGSPNGKYTSLLQPQWNFGLPLRQGCSSDLFTSSYATAHNSNDFFLAELCDRAQLDWFVSVMRTDSAQP